MKGMRPSTASRHSGTPVHPSTDDDIENFDGCRCLPAMPGIIERIGIGSAQIRASVLGGGVYMADGAELLLISSVATQLPGDWGVTAMQRGSLMTTIFLGMAAGNFLSGPLGDRFGRKDLVVISYLGMVVFGLMCAKTVSLVTLAPVCLCLGVSIGIGQPAWQALQTEITPARWRGAMMGITWTLFNLGEAFAACLLIRDDPQLYDLHWRWLLTVGALPWVVFFILSALFLGEAPQFLAVSGRREEAIAVLQSMRDTNAAGDFPVEFQASSPVTRCCSSGGSMFREYMLLLHKEMRSTTLIMMFLLVTVNFAFYGSLYAFPQVLRDVELGGSPGMNLLLGALAEIPGCLVAVAVGLFFPRKPAMLGFFITTGLAYLAFVVVAQGAMVAFVGPMTLQACYWIIKGSGNGAFLIVILYASEVFPTEVRATGLAACYGLGRISAMVAPMVFEALFAMPNGITMFFMGIAALMGLNVLAVPFLPFETFGAPLRDRVGGDASSIEAPRPTGVKSYGGAASSSSPSVPVPAG